jgi:hypothetical protein
MRAGASAIVIVLICILLVIHEAYFNIHFIIHWMPLTSVEDIIMIMIMELIGIAFAYCWYCYCWLVMLYLEQSRTYLCLWNRMRFKYWAGFELEP